MASVLQCFLNADLRSGHDGLADLAKKHDLNVHTLTPGQYVVFINSARDRMKLYAASNIIAYLKLQKGGKIDLRTVQEIPRAFNGSGRIDYDKALKQAVEKSMANRERKKGGNPLRVYAAMKEAGVA